MSGVKCVANDPLTQCAIDVANRYCGRLLRRRPVVEICSLPRKQQRIVPTALSGNSLHMFRINGIERNRIEMLFERCRLICSEKNQAAIAIDILTVQFASHHPRTGGKLSN